MVLAPVLIALLVQVPSSKAADAEHEQFQTLETQVSGAIQIKNAAALEQLLAKDFAFSLFLEGRAPQVMNRDEWLKTADHYTLKGFELRYLSVRVFGNVAAVRLQPNRKATVGTTVDRSGEFAVVDIWTKDGKAWKLSSRYLSRPDTIPR
jgi:ketosteroid isomerase-like protein